MNQEMSWAAVVKMANRSGLRCAICRRGEILHRRVALRGGLAAIAIALLVAGAGCAARPLPALTPGLEREEVLAKNQANAKLAD